MEDCEYQPLKRVKQVASKYGVPTAGKSQKTICFDLKAYLSEHAFDTHDTKAIETLEKQNPTKEQIQAAAFVRARMVEQMAPAAKQWENKHNIDAMFELSKNTPDGDIDKGRDALNSVTGDSSWSKDWGAWSKAKKMMATFVHSAKYLIAGIWNSPFFILILPGILATASEAMCAKFKEFAFDKMDVKNDPMAAQVLINQSGRDIFTSALMMAFMIPRSMFKQTYWVHEALVNMLDVAQTLLGIVLSAYLSEHVITAWIKLTKGGIGSVVSEHLPDVSTGDATVDSVLGVSGGMVSNMAPMIVGHQIFNSYFSIEACFGTDLKGIEAKADTASYRNPTK